MQNRGNDIMAQAVYLAQLEAQKGKCTCRTCAILRKASDSMVQQFLAPPGPAPTDRTALTAAAQALADTGYNPAEEE